MATNICLCHVFRCPSIFQQIQTIYKVLGHSSLYKNLFCCCFKNKNNQNHITTLRCYYTFCVFKFPWDLDSLTWYYGTITQFWIVKPYSIEWTDYSKWPNLHRSWFSILVVNKLPAFYQNRHAGAVQHIPKHQYLQKKYSNYCLWRD